MSKSNERGAVLRVYGTFLLAGCEFAVELEGLREVVNVPEHLQRMPLAPEYLLGLFHLRGRILPVIDLQVLLRLSSAKTEGSTPRLAILQQGAALVGVIFDALGEVLRASEEEIRLAAPQDGDDPSPVRGVIANDGGRRILQILDFRTLLSIRNLPAFTGGSTIDPQQRKHSLFSEKLVAFRTAGCTLAIDMKAIVRIVEAKDLQRTPRPSELCQEMLSTQGQLIPVVRTDRLFRLRDSAPTESRIPRVIVCRAGDQQIGLRVDEVTDLIPYSLDQVLPIPVLSEHMSDVLKGCFLDGAGRQVVVLNDTKLLARQEIRAIHLDFMATQKALVETEEKRAVTERHTVLTFRLGNLYGMRLQEVREILEGNSELVRTPNTPSVVLGAMDLRGTPVPVVDPKLLFAMEDPAPAVKSRILIFENEGKKIGMRVDSVESIVTVDGSLEQELPDLFFRTEQTRFQEGFERAISVTGKAGKKEAIVLLHARQVVGKLAQALSS